ncbi:MAG: protein kinase [Paramuribaculum sp.]|nr:protein kinase [Paramuribaculum sp.]MDE6487644.1 protein kinase [Paramuribaculum sp.]
MAAKDISEKWTELELLPEWDEAYYDVYTGKKHGKWVMLKTLKPQYKDDPRFQAMIEKEFDVRYNLAHPGIVMINDFEDVPGVGLSIITDDVYGLSLRKLIDRKEVTMDHVKRLCTQMVDAMEYIQTNHLVHFPLRPETVIFTENIGNLKLIDVGFDQRDQLTPAEATDDILAFGRILMEAVNAVPEAPVQLKRIAEKCCNPDPKARYRSIHQLRMALAQRSDNKFYIAIIVFLLAMIGILLWFNSSGAPKAKEVAENTAVAGCHIQTPQDFKTSCQLK